MKTDYLNADVMSNLSRLSERFGEPNTSVGGVSVGCGLASCGGACEGLSTPFI